MSTIAGEENISREVSTHPVHLKPDIYGNLPPSALVPFCSYQGNSSLLGEARFEFQNMTLCGQFQPTLLEGQLCYSLNAAEYKGEQTTTAKNSGLLLLLDPNPYEIRSTDGSFRAARNDQESFKVHIHTLARHIAFGPGGYAMQVLKRMTGKPSFYQLPDSQKECQVQSREKCQTEMFLCQVERNCSCVPWALTSRSSNTKASLEFSHKIKGVTSALYFAIPCNFFSPKRRSSSVGLSTKAVFQIKL